MSYYNHDWYYTAGPDYSDEDEYEAALEASEQQWEYEQDQQLLEESN